MQRRIARLVGDALGIHGGNESLRANASKSVTIDVEDISVLSVASAAGVQFLRRHAFNLSQQSIEQACVLVPVLSLLIQARELHVEHSALPLAEPVIGTIDKVAVHSPGMRPQS